MIKYIGIVFLLNHECKKFALYMKNKAGEALSNFKELSNNPHITAIHIANLNETGDTDLKQRLLNFIKNLPLHV